MTLTDDDASRQPLPFGFSFYGAQQSSLFVNSDGNLTFEDADTASSTRGCRALARRPAAHRAVLRGSRSVGGGRRVSGVLVECVRRHLVRRAGFESTRSTTVQVTLLPTGVIEMTFGEQIDLAEGIVAVSPGRVRETSHPWT